VLVLIWGGAGDGLMMEIGTWGVVGGGAGVEYEAGVGCMSGVGIGLC